MADHGTGIAVVVPAFDSAAVLPQALDSIRAQTLAPALVIVVDDGSRDDSAAVAERAGATVLRQDNAGPGAARNRGIRAADGCAWVALLDADDVLLPARLQRQMAELAARPEALGACGDALLLGGDRDGERKLGPGRCPPRIAFPDLLRGNPVINSTVLVRRRAVLDAGGFDEDRALIATEDYDLWLRLLDAPGAWLAGIDEPLVRYRVHAASLSAPDRFRAGLERIFARLVAAHPGDRAVRAAADRRLAEAWLDCAWHHARRREGAEARRCLRQARRLGAPRGRRARMWLRSWL